MSTEETKLHRAWRQMRRGRRMTVAVMLCSAFNVSVLLLLSDGDEPMWLRLFGVGFVVLILVGGYLFARSLETESISRRAYDYSRQLGEIEMRNLNDWAEYHAERLRTEAGYPAPTSTLGKLPPVPEGPAPGSTARSDDA